jgi:hypothetical protein
VLTDGEGSFATMAEVFPALASSEPWWLPVNVVLVRTGDTRVLVGIGQVARAGDGFRWASFAKEEGAPVE